MPGVNEVPHGHPGNEDVRNPVDMENRVTIFVPPVVVSNMIDRGEKAYVGSPKSPQLRAESIAAVLHRKAIRT